jgi:hypothetical protein
MFIDAQRVQGVTIANGGSGYLVGDVIYILTDNSPQFKSAQFKVASVDSSGAITSFSVLDYGGFLSAPASPVTISGGSGASATLNVTYTLYWQNAPWVVPTVDGLNWLLSTVVQNPVNEILSDGNTRGQALLSLIIDRIRSTIRTARRTPLSLTANSIPSESQTHCYALTLQMLVGSNANLARYVVSEAGAGKTPLALLIDEAHEWLKSVRDGKSVGYPSDPDNSFRTAVVEGAMSQEEDLTTFSGPNYWNVPTNDFIDLGQP